MNIPARSHFLLGDRRIAPRASAAVQAAIKLEGVCMNRKSLPCIDFQHTVLASTDVPAEPILIPGSKLRNLIGISAVTLWRWRRNKRANFPQATTINGRNYFSWAEVRAWLAGQTDSARR